MNNTEDWEKVKEIFSSAIEVEPAGRNKYVIGRCGGDENLLAEVESWLSSYSESHDYIETPAFSSSKLFGDPVVAEGRQFGSYRIIREIGHGGMGAVYLAERTDGEFEQQVALKIVRQSIADNHMIERFRSERQILASLNHPNIAKLLDGGVSQTDEPFLVMEYIDGQSLMDFADNKDLGIDDRLRLFLKVCLAVSYAHRNLVVHRDLKPGNALVTSEGEPKLLDFGLAKILDAASVSSDQTQTSFRALTPAYASPEQMRGETVSTLSDIYSLGAILYELLTNERPFHLEGKSLEEVLKTVADFEPPLPSTKPASAKLRGDLDNIVLMALRKEPERRYQSVEAFAGDIDKHLNGLPVSARPNTLKYRSGKFLQRHKAATIAAALILISLIGGIIASLWQAQIARREKEKAESINAFLEKTLKYSNPFLSPLKKNGQQTTVNEVLDEAAKRLDGGEFEAYPEVKAELERTIGGTYYGQGNYAQARKHMEQYVLLLRQLYGPDHPKMIIGSVVWAGLLFEKGEVDESESIYREYLPRLRAEFKRGNASAGTLADALNNFAYLRRTQGDSREAELLFRETVDLFPQLSGDSLTSVSTTRSTLASTIADQGRFYEALTTAGEAVEEYRVRGETDSASYGFSLTIYGGFLIEKGRYAEADAALTEGEVIFRRIFSTSGLWLGDNLRNQALSLYAQGKYAGAVEMANATLKIYDESFGKHYDQYPTCLIAKGLSLAKMGQVVEGEKNLREALEIRTSSLPNGHFWVATAKGALGEFLVMQKRHGEAEGLLRSSYESLKTSQEADSPRLEIARQRLVSLYQAIGRDDLAAQYRVQ